MPRPPSRRLRGAAADLDALLRELERNRAHERAGAERQDQADRSVRPLAGEPEQRADDERGCRQRTPSECRTHDGRRPYSDTVTQLG